MCSYDVSMGHPGNYFLVVLQLVRSLGVLSWVLEIWKSLFRDLDVGACRRKLGLMLVFDMRLNEDSLIFLASDVCSI